MAVKGFFLSVGMHTIAIEPIMDILKDILNF